MLLGYGVPDCRIIFVLLVPVDARIPRMPSDKHADEPTERRTALYEHVISQSIKQMKVMYHAAYKKLRGFEKKNFTVLPL